MGHFHTEVIATGKDKREAQQNAVSEFLHEHGHRHNLREVESAKLLRKVPPKKQMRQRVPGLGLVISSIEDPDAPQEQWLEEWEFVLHTHA